MPDNNDEKVNKESISKDGDMVIERPNINVITIRDKKSGLPFSKGILAASISVTGLDIVTSHKIAYEIEQYLN